MAHDFLASPATLAGFVSAFESLHLPPEQFTHAAHVALAACYAVRHGEAAFERIKEGLWRFHLAAGGQHTETSGYHETLTRFWCNVIADAVAGTADEWHAARHAVACFGGQRDLPSRCYSFDVAGSVEARRQWLPPDRAPAIPACAPEPGPVPSRAP
jgi:hypothetical protein